MINPKSTIFKFSEKVGLVIGKRIWYFIICRIVVFLGGKLVDSKIFQSVLNSQEKTT